MSGFPNALKKLFEKATAIMVVSWSPGARTVPAREKRSLRKVAEKRGEYGRKPLNLAEVEKEIVRLEKEMFKHAKNLEFEEAASTRDEIAELRLQFVSS